MWPVTRTSHPDRVPLSLIIATAETKFPPLLRQYVPRVLPILSRCSSIEASAVVPLISFLLISTAMRRHSIALRHQQQLGRAERDEAEAELELEVLRHHAP